MESSMKRMKGGVFLGSQEQYRNYFWFLWWKDRDANIASGLPNESPPFRRSVVPWLRKLWAEILSQWEQTFAPSRITVCSKELLRGRRTHKYEHGGKGLSVGIRSKRHMRQRGSLSPHICFKQQSRSTENTCIGKTKTKDLTFSDTQVERALGIHWSIQGDSFKFNNTLANQPGTRRGMLATVASIYNPLGFLAPYVLTGKKILQEMCRQGVGWDDPLPEMLRPR